MSSDFTSATADLDGYVPFPPERIEDYLERGYWRNLAFHEVLDRSAEADPDRTAVIGPTRGRTYGELAANTRRIAAALREEVGLGTDDMVGLWLPNSVEFVELFFACSRIGAVPVFLLPRHRRQEVSHVLDVTAARAIVTIDDPDGAGFDFVGLADEVTGGLPALDHRIAVTADGATPPDGWLAVDDLRRHDLDTELPRVNPCNPGLVMLSGGTSGLPKSIPRTHNDYGYYWERVAALEGVTSDWTVVPGVPLPHSFACGYAMGPAVWAGATLAVEPELKPGPLARLIERVGADATTLIPKQLIDLLDREATAGADLSSLQLVLSGGQKVPPDVTRRVTERWGVSFAHVFGMGEGIQIATRPEDPLELHQETVGRPVGEGDEVRVLDEDGAPVPEGELGELVVRGPGVFTGYLRNEAANAEDFDEGGWFHTGDVFARRPDGNYEVYGRLDDTINRAGETIYAPAVEDLLVEHPAVKTAAVVGIPDPDLGERVGAVVELEPGVETLTLDELVSFFDDRGAAVFKRPERLEIVDEMPETRVGKIARRQLRERLAGR